MVNWKMMHAMMKRRIDQARLQCPARRSMGRVV